MEAPARRLSFDDGNRCRDLNAGEADAAAPSQHFDAGLTRLVESRAISGVDVAGKRETIDAILEEVECRSPRRRVSLATLLTAVRRRYPQAHISWLVNRGYEPLLRGHPDLDEVLPFDRGATRHGLWTATQNYARFLRDFRARRFDLVIGAD